MLGMTALGALLLMYLMYQPSPASAAADDDDDDSQEPPPPPPRNFTIEQLHVRGVECCHGYGLFPVSGAQQHDVCLNVSICQAYCCASEPWSDPSALELSYSHSRAGTCT